ncbi:hypothetical protein N7499_002722 [Penicillium canescens]|nr:hypothetical protein N7499_002722 [Penicillium canescens]
MHSAPGQDTVSTAGFDDYNAASPRRKQYMTSAIGSPGGKQACDDIGPQNSANSANSRNSARLHSLNYYVQIPKSAIESVADM